MARQFSNSVKIRSPPSRNNLLQLLEEGIPRLIALLEEVNIHKILLFGSYATGNYRYGSDVDLLIIVDEEGEELFGEILDFLTDLSLDYDWSPHIVTKKRFKTKKNENEPFINHLLKTSLTLWSAEQ